MKDKMTVLEGLINDLCAEPKPTPQLGSAITELRAAQKNLEGHAEILAAGAKPDPKADKPK